MTWTTNHNKAAVHGLVTQPITTQVGHISWQLSVARLLAASADPVVTTVLFTKCTDGKPVCIYWVTCLVFQGACSSYLYWPFYRQIPFRYLL